MKPKNEKKGASPLNKKIFTYVRLAIYALTICQLSFNLVDSNIVTGILITLGVLCAVYDVFDLTRSYRKIEKKSKK